MENIFSIWFSLKSWIGLFKGWCWPPTGSPLRGILFLNRGKPTTWNYYFWLFPRVESTSYIQISCHNEEIVSRSPLNFQLMLACFSSSSSSEDKIAFLCPAPLKMRSLYLFWSTFSYVLVKGLWYYPEFTLYLEIQGKGYDNLIWWCHLVMELPVGSTKINIVIDRHYSN